MPGYLPWIATLLEAVRKWRNARGFSANYSFSGNLFLEQLVKTGYGLVSLGLDDGVKAAAAYPKDTAKVKALRKAWLQKKTQSFAGKLTKPDAEDPDTANHFELVHGDWVLRGLSRWKKVRLPSEFNKPAPAGDMDDN